MSTLQYVLLLLVLLTVAVEAKKILRAQAGATTTGEFMVVLDLDTSNERFDELIKMIGIQANDQKIHKVNGDFAKVISTKLSEAALEMVCLIIMHACMMHNTFIFRSKMKLM